MACRAASRHDPTLAVGFTWTRTRTTATGEADSYYGVVAMIAPGGAVLPSSEGDGARGVQM